MQGRSGSLQAALCLEIAHEEITRFNIKLEGLNGQLPNLDLVNTAMQLCRDQGMQPTLQKQVCIECKRNITIEDYQTALAVERLLKALVVECLPTGYENIDRKMFSRSRKREGLEDMELH